MSLLIAWFVANAASFWWGREFGRGQGWRDAFALFGEVEQEPLTSEISDATTEGGSEDK